MQISLIIYQKKAFCILFQFHLSTKFTYLIFELIYFITKDTFSIRNVKTYKCERMACSLSVYIEMKKKKKISLLGVRRE